MQAFAKKIAQHKRQNRQKKKASRCDAFMFDLTYAMLEKIFSMNCWPFSMLPL